MKVAERKAPVPPDLTGAWIFRACRAVEMLEHIEGRQAPAYTTLGGMLGQLRAVADVDDGEMLVLCEQHLKWLESLPYDQYLLTEDWKQTRRFALRRAERRCQNCNDPKSLQVHHRSYRDLGAELLSDLTVLCDGCHAAFHEHRELAGGAA